MHHRGVVSATEQDFEPTKRRSWHGIGTSRWKFKQRFAGAHPHQVCLVIANIKYKRLVAIENPALIKRSTVIEKDLRLYNGLQELKGSVERPRT
jgi:hypothetical protein